MILSPNVKYVPVKYDTSLVHAARVAAAATLAHHIAPPAVSAAGSTQHAAIRIEPAPYGFFIVIRPEVMLLRSPQRLLEEAIRVEHDLALHRDVLHAAGDVAVVDARQRVEARVEGDVRLADDLREVQAAAEWMSNVRADLALQRAMSSSTAFSSGTGSWSSDESVLPRLK